MLLSLQEEGAQKTGEEGAEEDAGVPAGSTVLDLSVTPPTATGALTAGTATADLSKNTPTKKPDAKNDPAHLAAKAILEKYSRRTRG